MTVFYIVMGGTLRYYLEAYLSIRTFQKQLNPANGRICVLTDHPSFFAKAGVKVLPVSDQQKADWMGRHNFFFRTKIKGMEYLHQLYPADNLLYLDSDTFLYGSLEELEKRLDSGHALMHLCEGRPAAISNTARRLWKGAEGRSYGGIVIGEKHQMWNAGVVALPAATISKTVASALALCDGMLDDGNNEFITEQYAYSIALQEHTTLMASDDIVGHYWGNAKDWNQKAADIFLTAYLNNASLEEELAALDIDDLCQTPVFLHRSHRGQQLQSLVSRLFADSDKRFVGKAHA